jgi:hypothetical protein
MWDLPRPYPVLMPVETDLGEYIVQLRGERPAHIITPAVHLRRHEVGQLFHEKLGLPYRLLKLCTAELGFASSMSYDIEMYAPGCEEWLEVSSCSNCGDFQARRANIRYRPRQRCQNYC